MFAIYDQKAREYVSTFVDSAHTDFELYWCDSHHYALQFETHQKAADKIAELMQNQFDGFYPNEMNLVVVEV